MGRSAVRLVLAVALFGAPARARADASIAVTRDDEQCPDEAELRRLAASSRVPSLSPPTHVYRVVFTRAGRAYRAEIVDDTAQRIRRLEDRGTGCAPIGQAAAVILATMWSSERDEAPPPAPAPAPVLPAVASSVDRAIEPTPVSASRTRWVFAAGPALAAGVVRSAAPAVLADVALESAPWSFALGALWIPDQGLALAPGTIDVQLLAGGARGCAFAGHEAHVGVCGRLLGGALLASATGFDVDGTKARPWFAAGLEVFVEGPLGAPWLRYRAGVAGLLPLHAESFSVAGAGSPYETPAVGGLFSVGLEVAR